MSSSPVVGIDLGTTNTVVGVVEGGNAQALADEHDQRLIPSVVSFHPNGSVIVGARAKERRLVDATNTIYSIKRLIGRSWSSEEVVKARQRFPFQLSEGPGQSALVTARGQTYTLPEISAFVLRRAREVAERAMGTTLERAVITVPANFNDLQRAATKVAGRVAGIDVLRILNEPTAAALAYGFGKDSNERLAVYDFGGGTFDLTLLDLSANVFEVLATAGNTFLGGDDMDLAIAERMAHEFLLQSGYDARSDAQAFERLRMAAEVLKIRLSTETEASVDVPEVAHGVGGKSLGLSFAMKRSEFEALLEPLLRQTLSVCKEALASARLSTKDFDKVLLVGGSTRIPLVRQRVEAFFGRPALGDISPDEVVAIGAAIQAAALTGVERKRNLPAAPRPAARAEPQDDKKGGTLPPGAPPPPSHDPSTAPYRRRVQTAPGLQSDGDAQKHIVVRSRRVPTGRGLGFEVQIEQARRDYEEREQASAIVPPEAKPFPPTELDDPTKEAGHISSFLARYASVPNKPRQPTPGIPARPQDDSGAYRLSHDDISFDDPSAVEDPDEEVTQVGRRAARTSALERSLPVPSVSDVPPVPRKSAPPRPPPPPRRLAPDAEPEPPPTLATAVEAPPADAPAVPPPPAALLSQPQGPTPAREPKPEPERPPLAAPGTAPWAAGVGALGLGLAVPQAATVQDKAPSPPLLVDVTPLTLVVETVHGYCEAVIGRNAPVPSEKSLTFATAVDGQTAVRVRVAQGESKAFGENTLLGEVELSGLTPAPRGFAKVEVSFKLDTDGMLNVKAVDAATGNVADVVLRLLAVPGSAEVASMTERQAGLPVVP